MHFNSVLDVRVGSISIFELFCVKRAVKANEIKVKELFYLL